MGYLALLELFLKLLGLVLDLFVELILWMVVLALVVKALLVSAEAL